MPRGFHCGHSETRNYTTEKYRIAAISFKNLLTGRLGKYQITWSVLTDEHRKFELLDTKEWGKLMLFQINGNKCPIPLSLDHRSASNKLYLICPYCANQRQHLYAMRYGYACRECAQLHYPSQSEREEARLMRRIRKKRIQVWGHDWPDVYNLFDNSAFWPKPKGMRWATFERHQVVLKQLEDRHLRVMTRWFSHMNTDKLDYF